MAVPELVVMAAGIGSRYGGLKQIDPVGPGGEIVLDYAVYDAVRGGFGKIIFVIRRDIEEAFRDRVGRSIEKHVDTAYVFQELDSIPNGFSVPLERTKPWGTAHAVLCAKEAVDAPFAVINADDFYGAGAFKTLCDYLRKAKDKQGTYDFCMVGYMLANTLTEHGHVARGICGVKDGLLCSLVERTKIRPFDGLVKYADDDDRWVQIPPDSIASMNMWGFTPGLFGELEARFPVFLSKNLHEPKAEFFVPTIVNELIQEAKATVRVLPTDEKWFGVTYRQDMPELQEAIGRLVAEGSYPERLWS